jgi:hypothetical protein
MMKNNIVFNYTVPEYKKYLNAEYQYLLEGFQDDWSEWSTKRCEFLCLRASMYLKLGLNLQILYRYTAVYSFTVLSLGIGLPSRYSFIYNWYCFARIIDKA